MQGWFGDLSPEQIAAYLAQPTAASPSSHAKTGAGSKAEPLDPDVIRELNEIASRTKTPAEDPDMAIPEYVPANDKLEALHHRALFFLNQLEQTHLLDQVLVESPFVWFLGHRVYIVPTPGAGPDFMFEAWWKGEEEWEKRGVFADAYRTFEHVYFRVMRARIGDLVRAAK